MVGVVLLDGSERWKGMRLIGIGVYQECSVLLNSDSNV